MKLKQYLPKKLLQLWKVSVVPYIKDPFFLNKWDSPHARDKVAGRITGVVNTGYKRLVSHDDYKADLYMFMEDMTNFIMPFSHRVKNLKVILIPKNDKKERLIIESFNNNHDRNLADAVGEFIRETGQSLFSHSEVFYEVKVTKNEQGKITKLELFDIYAPSMIKVLGYYFQFIPWKAAESAGTKAGIRRIPNESVLHIKFPDGLGGKSGIKRIIKRLASLSKVFIPDFQMNNLDQKKQTGFDLDTYIEAKYVEKAQLTKKMGWNQRKIPDNTILEYYSIHRHLMFAHSQSLIREHILMQLNMVIQKHLNTKIEMTGLLTTKQINEELKLLNQGDLEFNKLFKRTSQY